MAKNYFSKHRLQTNFATISSENSLKIKPKVTLKSFTSFLPPPTHKEKLMIKESFVYETNLKLIKSFANLLHYFSKML